MSVTIESALARAFRNSPRHAGRLAKAYAVLVYELLYRWADRRRPFQLDASEAEIKLLRSQLAISDARVQALQLESATVKRELAASLIRPYHPDPGRKIF